MNSVSQKVPLCWADDYFPIASRWRIFIYVITGSRMGYFAPSKVKETMYRPEEGLRFSGIWGFQISQKSAYESGKVVSPTHRRPLSNGKYSWYSFLLQAESTQELWCGISIKPMKNSSDTIGNRTRGLQTFTAVPQPTAPSRNAICAPNRSKLSCHQ